MITTFDEFQQSARRTYNDKLSVSEATRHAVFGLTSEAGEIAGMFQKRYQGHAVDTEKLKDEAGDVLWMLSELCDCFGISMQEVAQHNKEKLEKRYPNGFDGNKSVNREEYRKGCESIC